MTETERTQIYLEYKPKVLGYIYNKVLDNNLAEDLCSDVFLKVYEKLDTFDETKASLSTWIFTIMKNTLYDYYRGRKVMEEIPEDMADGSSVEEDACRNDTLELLAGALGELDERARDIIIMRYYHGMKLVDIAERMEISYPYVKLLHKQALSVLKGKLTKLDIEL